MIPQAKFPICEIRLISFIIPAWNEETVLAPTIEALKAAARGAGEPCEVIVVDDASTDQTAEVARQCGAQVVPVHHRQIAATRNSGAGKARGELLIFVDADTIVTQEAVRAAVESVRLGAVGGGSAFRFSGRIPFYARVLQAVTVRVYRLARIASGCFIFCTRDAFRAVGGFRTDLYAGEEAAMSLALRRQGRFVILPQVVITSGRKLRTHSSWEIFSPILRIIFRGRRCLRDRSRLDIWYGDRRPDPQSAIE